MRRPARPAGGFRRGGPRVCVLMSRYALPIVLAVALCVSCKQRPQQPARQAAPAAGPQVRATVLTVRTTIQPGDKTHTHTVVIAKGRARSTAEHDAWRLYDTNAKTITLVDDVARTFRVEQLEDALQQRRAALAGSLPTHYPRMTLVHTRERRPILGVSAEEHLISNAGYKRQLWLAEHPAVPRGLFAMMQAGERASSPLAPITRAAEESLLAVRGFPFLDRSEITYGNQKMVVERTVTALEERQVPASQIEVPRGYKDITPKPTAPAKKKDEKKR